MFEGVELRREIPNDTLKLRDGGAVRRLGERLAGEDFDVVHCHDHLMLRVGAEVKRRRKDVCLVYDSHELLHGWPLNLDEGTPWTVRIKSHLARRLAVKREAREARLADFVITVNDSLADDLKTHFARRERPVVLRNAPRLVPLPLRTQRLRERFSIPSDQRILVFVRSRLHTRTLNLERVLDEFRHRPDVALVFISGQPLAGNEVVAYARQHGCVNALLPRGHTARRGHSHAGLGRRGPGPDLEPPRPFLLVRARQQGLRLRGRRPAPARHGATGIQTRGRRVRGRRLCQP